jgi:hypothetical protein
MDAVPLILMDEIWLNQVITRFVHWSMSEVSTIIKRAHYHIVMLGLLGWLSEDIDHGIPRGPQAIGLNRRHGETVRKKAESKTRCHTRRLRRAWVAGPLRENLAAHINAFVSKDGRIELIRRMRTGKGTGLVSDDSCVPIRLCTAGRSN